MKPTEFAAPYVENRSRFEANGCIIEADSSLARKLVASLEKVGVQAVDFRTKEDFFAYARCNLTRLEFVSTDGSTLLGKSSASDPNYIKAVGTVAREARSEFGDHIAVMLHSTAAGFARVGLAGEVDQFLDKEGSTPSKFAREILQLAKLARLRSLENELLASDAMSDPEPFSKHEGQTPAKEARSILLRVRKHLSGKMSSLGAYDPSVVRVIKALQALGEWPTVKIGAFADATWQSKIVGLLTLLSLRGADVRALLQTDVDLREFQIDPKRLGQDGAVGKRAVLLLDILSSVLRSADFAVYPLRWYWADPRFFSGRFAPPWSEIGLGEYLLDKDISDLKRCSTWLRDH